MGDQTTHAVLYSAYWYLVYEFHGFWLESNTGRAICACGVEDRKVSLENQE